LERRNGKFGKEEKGSLGRREGEVRKEKKEKFGKEGRGSSKRKEGEVRKGGKGEFRKKEEEVQIEGKKFEKRKFI
jgi:hypothetical protein